MSDINFSLLPRRDLEDVLWGAVQAIEAVHEQRSEVAIRFINGVTYAVTVPSELFHALIEYGKMKYANEDMELDDRERGLY